MDAKVLLGSDDLDALGRGYPRPMLRRRQWVSLNGDWSCTLDPHATHRTPDAVPFDQKIRVPFSPETPASGIEHAGFLQRVWYRHSFTTPPVAHGHHVILHFGAVDYDTTVWVNGRLVGRHEGGYTPFRFDITDALEPQKGKRPATQTVTVCADDDPHDLCKPRGKQDWQEQPHSIWYCRTTGVWQTVWLEVVPAARIVELKWTPNVERGEIALDAYLDGDLRPGMRLAVTLTAHGRTLCDDSYALPCPHGVPDREVNRAFSVHQPGTEDFYTDLLWGPEHPNLIDATVRLLDDSGTSVDKVSSYTALRTVGVRGDRFVLNRRPVYLRLVLDQGYWRETGLTAPDDAAFVRDIELVKAMGFNGVRKHQKIEDPRFLYHADRLGLLVWGEMPSPYRFAPQTVRRTASQWAQAVRRDVSHPCIVTWVPINESWGVPDLPVVEEQRQFVRAMYHLTKSLDGTRPVIGNDGWELVAGDLLGIHNYDQDPQDIVQRYNVDLSGLNEMFYRDRRGGRTLTVAGEFDGQPLILSEFGGIAYSPHQADWGYSRVGSAEDLATRYEQLLAGVRSIRTLAGFCYTQLTDTYQEANGLLEMDRTPKFPIERIRHATSG